jgi:hypothetical protein
MVAHDRNACRRVFRTRRPATHTSGVATATVQCMAEAKERFLTERCEQGGKDRGLGRLPPGTIP